MKCHSWAGSNERPRSSIERYELDLPQLVSPTDDLQEAAQSMETLLLSCLLNITTKAGEPAKAHLPPGPYWKLYELMFTLSAIDFPSFLALDLISIFGDLTFFLL